MLEMTSVIDAMVKLNNRDSSSAYSVLATAGSSSNQLVAMREYYNEEIALRAARDASIQSSALKMEKETLDLAAQYDKRRADALANNAARQALESSYTSWWKTELNTRDAAIARSQINLIKNIAEGNTKLQELLKNETPLELLEMGFKKLSLAIRTASTDVDRLGTSFRSLNHSADLSLTAYKNTMLEMTSVIDAMVKLNNRDSSSAYSVLATAGSSSNQLVAMREYYNEEIALRAARDASIQSSALKMEKETLDLAAQYDKRRADALASNAARQALESSYTSWWEMELKKRDGFATQAAIRMERETQYFAAESAKRLDIVYSKLNAEEKARQEAISKRKALESSYTSWWEMELKKRDDISIQAAIRMERETQYFAAESAKRLDIVYSKLNAEEKARQEAVSKRKALESSYTGWWEMELQKRDALTERQTLRAAASTASNSTTTPSLADHYRGLGYAEGGGNTLQKLEEQHRNLATTTKASKDEVKAWNTEAKYTHDIARGAAAGVGMLWMTWGNMTAMAAGFTAVRGMNTAMKDMAEIEESLIQASNQTGNSVDNLNEKLMSLFNNGVTPMMEGPREIADAYKEMIFAGFNAEKALELLVPAMKFARVGGLELNDSVSTIQKTLNAFSIEKTEAGAYRVADVLKKTADATATSIAGMSSAMNQAVTAGGVYGATLEDVALNLGMLAKVGIDFSAAGTATKNFMAELAAPKTEKAREALKAMGLDFYDASNKAKPFVQVVREARGVWQELNETNQKQFIQNLQDVFGERGLRNAPAILKMSNDELEDLINQMKNASGTVSTLYQRLSEGTKGTWQQVKVGLEVTGQEAIKEMDQALKDLGLTMLEFVRSDEFKSFLKGVITTLKTLTELVVDHGKEIGIVIAAYAGFKVVSGLVGMLGGAIKLLSWTAFIKDVAQAKTGVEVLSEAVGTGTGAAGLAARLTAMGAIGVKVLAAGGLLYGATLAYKELLESVFGEEYVLKWENRIIEAFTRLSDRLKDLAAIEAPWWAKPFNLSGGLGMGVPGAGGGALSAGGVVQTLIQAKNKVDGTASKKATEAGETWKATSSSVFPRSNMDRLFGGPAIPNTTTNSSVIKSMGEMYSRPVVQSDVTGLYPASSTATKDLKDLKDTKDTKEQVDAYSTLLGQAKDFVTLREAALSIENALTGEMKTYIKMSNDVAQLEKEKASGKSKGELKTLMPKAKAIAEEAEKVAELNREIKNVSDAYDNQMKVVDNLAQSESNRIKQAVQEGDKDHVVAGVEGEVLAYSTLDQQLTITIDHLTKLSRSKASLEALRQNTDGVGKEIDALTTHTFKLVEDTEATVLAARAKESKANTKYLDNLSEETAKLEEATQAQLRKYATDEQAALMSEADIERMRRRTTEEERYAQAIAKVKQELAQKQAAASSLMDLIDSSTDINTITAARQHLITTEKDIGQVSAALAELQKKAKVAGQAAASMVSDWDKAAKDIGKTLTDAFMGAFESGKDFAKQLRLTIINAFKDIYLKPIAIQLTTTVMGAVGMGGSGSAAASGGGGSDPVSTLSSLNSAYKAVANGFTSLGNTAGSYAIMASQGGSMGSTVMAGSQQAAMLNAQGMGGYSVSSLGGAVGSAASTLGGMAVGYVVGKMISGGYSAIGKSGNTAVAVGTAIGAIWGPLGAAIGGAVGGLVNRTFGRKLAGTGIEGSFGAGNFSGTNYEYYKGGTFRSDKTKRSDLDPQVDALLDTSFATLQTKTALMATVLGQSASAINAFTSSIKLDFKGLTDKEIEEKIGAVFDDMGNSMASLIPGLEAVTRFGESSSAALTRLYDSIFAVNGLIDTLNLQLFDVSLSGAAMASSLADAFGGMDKLQSATSAYYSAFYTEEQRIAESTQQLTQAMSNLGYTLPASKEGFRDVVAGLNLTTTAGQQTFAALMGLAPMFAEVADSWEVAAKEAAESAAAAAKEAAESAAAAAKEAADRAAEVLDERATLETALLEIQGDTVALRALELKKIDPTNRALKTRIWALQDEKEVLDERLTLESRVYALQGDFAKLREIELDTISPANTALQQRIWALEDEEAALEAAKKEAAALITRLTGKTGFVAALDAASLQAAATSTAVYGVATSSTAAKISATSFSTYLTGALVNAFTGEKGAKQAVKSLGDYLVSDEFANAPASAKTAIAALTTYLAGTDFANAPASAQTALTTLATYLGGTDFANAPASAEDEVDKLAAYLSGASFAAAPVAARSAVTKLANYLAGKDFAGAPVAAKTAIAALIDYLAATVSPTHTTALTEAQNATNNLYAEIDVLRGAAASAQINIGALKTELSSLDVTVVADIVVQVFENVAARLEGVLSDIGNERVAVREAVIRILEPSVKGYDQIKAEIDSTSVALPDKSWVDTAQQIYTTSLKSFSDYKVGEELEKTRIRNDNVGELRRLNSEKYDQQAIVNKFTSNDQKILEFAGTQFATMLAWAAVFGQYTIGGNRQTLDSAQISSVKRRYYDGDRFFIPSGSSAVTVTNSNPEAFEKNGNKINDYDAEKEATTFNTALATAQAASKALASVAVDYATASKTHADATAANAQILAIDQSITQATTNLKALVDKTYAENLAAAKANSEAKLKSLIDAQLDYSKAVQQSAVDAANATAKLGRLREETVKYYEQQKQLAELMTRSASTLRGTVESYRFNQLSEEQKYTDLKAQFASSYSLASLTTGEELAKYADRMNDVFGQMLGLGKDGATFNTEIESAAKQLETIATKLETEVIANTFQADSINLLTSIDGTLEALGNNTQIMVDAINASKDQTNANLAELVRIAGGTPAPAFAAGGFHSGGLRLVGERGPELEVTGPARIYSAAQTRAILSGGENDEALLAELRALRASNDAMRFELRAIAVSTNKSAKLHSEWDGRGLTVKTDSDQPIQVEVTA
jgi:TP901 family phage tail tape measure protein